MILNSIVTFNFSAFKLTYYIKGVSSMPLMYQIHTLDHFWLIKQYQQCFVHLIEYTINVNNLKLSMEYCNEYTVRVWKIQSGVFGNY